jgi:EAL domain-containing protein (putative c-di-GMP-specific phosphodiesterase class I)
MWQLLNRFGMNSPDLDRVPPPPVGMYWVFQPINYVSSGEIFGYEALCRWDSPKLGSVSPELFI